MSLPGLPCGFFGLKEDILSGTSKVPFPRIEKSNRHRNERAIQYARNQSNCSIYCTLHTARAHFRKAKFVAEC